MSDTVGVAARARPVRHARRRRAADPRRPGRSSARSLDIADAAARGARPARRPAPADAATRRRSHEVLVEARSRLDRALGERCAAIETPVEDAKQRKLRAQTDDRPGHRAPRPRARRARRLRRLRVRRARAARASRSPRSTSARRCATGVWDAAHRGPDQRDDPDVARRHASGCRPSATDVADVGSPFDYASTTRCSTARCTCPTRESPQYRDAVHDELAALITAAGGRTLALFTSWKAMDHAAAAVRERVDVPILTQRDLPKPALVRALRRRRGDVPVRHRRLLPGRRRPGPHAVAWSSSTGCRSRGPTTRCCRPAASCSGRRRSPDRPAAGGDAARPGCRPADPHRRPTAASSPCSTAGSARPATAGTSSAPCRRCAAPATAPRSRRSSRDRCVDSGRAVRSPDVRMAPTSSSDVARQSTASRRSRSTRRRNRNALSRQLVADLNAALDAPRPTPTGVRVDRARPTPARRSAPAPTSRSGATGPPDSRADGRAS